MRISRASAFAVALLLSCAGDDDAVTDGSTGDGSTVDGPDFDVRYHTDFVDIAPGFSQPVCQGTRDEIDRHAAALADLLDIELETRPTWYWFNGQADGSLADTSDSSAWCSGGTACTASNGTAVYARFDPIFHELVHASVIPNWGRSDVLFEEGIAHSLGRTSGSFDGVSTIYDLLTDTAPSDIAGGTRHGAAHFSRWLVDRFGPAKFSELFAPRLGTSSTKEDVFAAVEEVYGLPFDELEDEYFATAPTVYPIPAFCDGLVEMPRNGDRWEITLDTNCDAPHVFGPRDHDALNYVVFTIDIPPELVDEPLATWTPSLPENTWADVWPCIEEPLYDADPELTRGTSIDNFGPTPFRRSGRHRIELPVSVGGSYVRVCQDNGKFPGAYPQDRTIDPENCLGD